METLLPPGAAPSESTSKPHVVIQPSAKWAPLNLRDIWLYRELLYFLTWRDVKVRYKQAALGVAWAVIQPLATMLIFTLLFGRLANLQQHVNVPYPIFAFAGLLPWTFFSNAVNNSGNSLVSSANLITKVYFPRMIVPAAAVGASLVDLAIAFGLLVLMMFYYQAPLSANLLLLPFLVLITTTLALGFGMWMSALNVKYRDIRHALPFIMQLWMFASPIIYPVNLVGEKWQWLLELNPLTGLIGGFRAAFLGMPLNGRALAISAIFAIAILIYAMFTFRRMEKSFADIV
jgi:lipopolysaccharide transport system permease protein